MRSILYLLAVLSCLSCNYEDLRESSIKEQRNQTHNSTTNIESKQPESSHLEIDAGIKLSAKLDGDTVTILNYPEVSREKVSLTRFDGRRDDVWPFSKEYCDNIRKWASNHGISQLIRSNYPSLITFEIPVFIGPDFIDSIMRSAASAGINASSLYLSNPVSGINSSLELEFKDGAISKILGDLDVLKNQLHLGQRGIFNRESKYQVIVHSADIICDLVFGDATMSMIYQVKDGSPIKVTYDPMIISI